MGVRWGREWLAVAGTGALSSVPGAGGRGSPGRSYGRLRGPGGPARARRGPRKSSPARGPGSARSRRRPVLLHPSVIERFATCAPGLSGLARRTLRTNLRFLARRGSAQLHRRTRRCPASAPRPRTRRRDQRLPGAGRCPAHGGAADAGRSAGLPRGRGRADPRRPAAGARHRHRLPVRRRPRRPSAAAARRGRCQR